MRLSSLIGTAGVDMLCAGLAGLGFSAQQASCHAEKEWGRGRAEAQKC